MQLPISPTSQPSTSSDLSAKMAVDTPTSPQKVTVGGAPVSPTAVNQDIWIQAVVPSKPRVLPEKGHSKLGASSRGRLPSIEEIQAPPRFKFPAQGDFSQMFISNNNAIFVKRRTPPPVQHVYSGYKPVKDRIIRHSLSDSNLRARVEPLPDNAHHGQLPNGLLETVNVRSTPAPFVTRQSATAAASSRVEPSSITSPHRETVTIDGKARRVRFLSADHTPLREDPEFRKLLLKNNKNDDEVKLKSKGDKPVNLRSVTVAQGRKGVVERETVTSRTENKKESPDVWLERARKLRAAKDKTNAAKSDTKKSESQKFHEDEDEISKKNTSEVTPKHINFCDAKKTEWIIRWLEEVNKQTHFDVIE